MKVLPFKVPKPNDDALIYQEDHEFILYDKLHQHEEIQVSYIAKGTGTLLVGNTVNTYSKGDILVIGSNLPHVFKSEQSSERSLVLTLFFTKDSFGKGFFQLEEMQAISTFLKRSINGFKTTKHKLGHIFLKLKDQNKFERFLSLLIILRKLSISKYKVLSSFIYEKQYSDNEGKRISAVMEFTMNNFKDSITLDQVASIANMTKNAFCKYFKKRTNKTYFSFLNELKIEHACKLLSASNELSIVEIAELSGFNNLSNFNRQFKNLKSTTPLTYRKNH